MCAPRGDGIVACVPRHRDGVVACAPTAIICDDGGRQSILVKVQTIYQLMSASVRHEVERGSSLPANASFLEEVTQKRVGDIKASRALKNGWFKP